MRPTLNWPTGTRASLPSMGASIPALACNSRTFSFSFSTQIRAKAAWRFRVMDSAQRCSIWHRYDESLREWAFNHGVRQPFVPEEAPELEPILVG